MSVSLFVVLLCLLVLVLLGAVYVARIYSPYWTTRPGGKEEQEFLETPRDP